MTSVNELMKVGQELGYTDEALRNFVKEEQAREREERHSRLEAEKERFEAEKERLEAEKDRLELEARLAKEKLEAEKERLEAEKDRLELEARLAKEKLDYEFKISREKLEIEIGMEKEKLSNEARVAKEKLDYGRQLEREKEEAETRKLDTEHKMKIELDMLGKKSVGKVKVKMTPFDEKIDSMDAYLNVYETFASAQNWEHEMWSLNLPFLLKGTAREVFDRLPLEDRTDYDKLKDALLRQFELTDDGYKKKFRTERPREK
ncbi:uncharacterized abhydrolase domain-containing protein DDB_G0269086-like [Ruditapes philippinarum]|uniref:uncharacterized abhydrolase domain-containing protein DDB_G0269086-like n=1 Tax=Ruditapes philippinarum TaxID=129788 RepID=UPI00295BC9A6|nr:uncharacterized abhydrolase domain-containing protein DDB_G0269086-like [Ruditapes philippinarum]